MGWLKRADRDAEMWPEETFGGVSDEQFWDDMSSDKPLATTARTAQPPEGEPRRRPAPAEGRLAAPPAKSAPVKPVPVKAAAPSGQATTQAFPVSAIPLGAGALTGPQPVRGGTQPIRTGAQPVHTGPQPVLTGPPQLIRTGPQPVLPPRPVAAPLTAPPAAPLAAPAQPARGRHSTGEDPLTSDAFSVRSSTDSRSYRSARQSSGLSRDQYEAALAQETQTFSLNDPPSGGYPAQQQYEAPRGRRHADERSSGSYPVQPPARPAETGGYSRDGYASPASQYSYGQPAPAPPYGDSFDYQDDARRPVPARESAARESAVSGRPPRPVYSSGSHRVPYDPRGGERRLTGRARRRHHLVYRAAAS
ncbi:MAG TPA: hypothetical protein VN969_33935 [Streptosporangiaceae bacterium]|nr:hypothetical protein [Streptosporangiaceae bacterium]